MRRGAAAIRITKKRSEQKPGAKKKGFGTVGISGVIAKKEENNNNKTEPRRF